MHVADRRDEGGDLNAVGELEVFLGDGASGNAADRLAGRSPAATAARPYAVLLLVGVVGVAGSREHIHCLVSVVLGPLIFILNNHADGATEGLAVFGSRLDGDLVLLVTGCSNTGLTGSAAGHLGLDVLLGQFHAGWASIDYTTDGSAVRLAIGGYSKELAESRHVAGRCSSVLLL